MNQPLDCRALRAGIALLPGLFGARSVQACSRIVWFGEAGPVLVGSNMDRLEPMREDSRVLPHGIARDGAVSVNLARWTARWLRGDHRLRRRQRGRHQRGRALRQHAQSGLYQLPSPVPHAVLPRRVADVIQAVDPRRHTMARANVLCSDIAAAELRRLARRSPRAAQVWRLLAVAAIDDGRSRPGRRRCLRRAARQCHHADRAARRMRRTGGALQRRGAGCCVPWAGAICRPARSIMPRPTVRWRFLSGRRKTPWRCGSGERASPLALSGQETEFPGPSID